MNKKASKRKLKRHLTKRGDENNFEMTPALVTYWWRVLNKALFDDVLLPPKAILVAKMSDSWGWCMTDRSYSKNHPVVITLSTDIDERELLIEVLAHEMIHQWQQQIYGWMSHGKVFRSFIPRLKQVGIKLDIKY